MFGRGGGGGEYEKGAKVIKEKCNTIESLKNNDIVQKLEFEINHTDNKIAGSSILVLNNSIPPSLFFSSKFPICLGSLFRGLHI